MATFCIPPILAERLKAAAQRGEIDIEKMYDMDSAERRALFENYVEKDIAKKINLGFEKAMVSTKVTALQKWASDVFVGKDELKKKKKDIIDRIQELNEAGVLTPEKEKAFLEDLVAEKLGLTVTTEESQKISELATQLQELAKEESDFGTPSLEYFDTRRKMQEYIESITPSSRVKIATSIIARGNMLLRISSPFLNIESNTVMGGIQALARRIETKSIGGVSNSYASNYAKFAIKVYQKTGYDISRMLSLQDDFTVRGEDIVTSSGKGAVRKVGRFYEDVVFKTMQGLPDVVFSSFAAADRANIESTKLARAEGLKGKELEVRALEIMKDATRIDPQTNEGRDIRDASIADAMYTTYTNKSLAADVSLAIRKVFNIASGDARIGDQIMPFVKTPANVIQTGINMSGIGLPIDATVRMFKVLSDIKTGTGFSDAVKDQYQGFFRTVVQAGIGLAFAHIISSLFEPEDFIGEYPTSQKEAQLLALKNATTNSVKIGDRWVSLDYFGPLGSAITGMLYAKKYGDTLPDKTYQYVKGAFAQAAKLPGAEELGGWVSNLDDFVRKTDRTADEDLRDIGAYLVGFVQSRTTPGILYDIARMSDTSERRTDQGDVFDKVRNALPFIRESLPAKQTVYGDEVKTEPAWSTLLFGSRVKTARDNKLIQELDRLDQTGNLPSITDVSKTSPRAKELKTQIGDKRFAQFMTEFGTILADRTTKAINSPKYQRLPDDKKKSELDKMKTDIFDKLLKRYGYRKTIIK